MPNIPLEKGTTYRGRGILFFPWSELVTRSRAKTELEKNGFSNVTVWMSSKELPADWPTAARSDESGFGQTQIYIEGIWANETGSYPSSGSKWAIHDYWIQKQAPKAAPPPASCKAIGDACALPSDCCSGACTDGICADASTVPIPVNVQCASMGMSCENADCCEGNTCQDDSEGYWGGGKRCLPENTGENPNPIQVGGSTDTSHWWYLAGAAVIAGMGWLLWPKSPRRPAHANPTRSLTELSDWAVKELVRIEAQGHGEHKRRSRRGVWKKFVKEMIAAGMGQPGDEQNRDSFISVSWRNVKDIADIQINAG